MKLNNLSPAFAGLISLAAEIPANLVGGAIELKPRSVFETTNLLDLPYTLTKAKLRGMIAGQEVEFEGTAAEIQAKLDTQYPGLDANTTSRREVSELDARSKTFHLCCNQMAWGWQYTGIGGVWENIDYLDRLGEFGWHVGGRSCVRIACNWGSGVILCNDNPYEIAPHSRYLSTYALELTGACNNHRDATCGQKFDTDSYNIIVRGGEQGCGDN